MDHFISENILSGKILDIEFDPEAGITPIRKWARAVYDQTAPTSNHFPVHVELLSGEKEAIEMSANLFSRGMDRFGNDRAKLKEHWLELSSSEKLQKTIQLAVCHLVSISMALEDEVLSPADSTLSFFDIGELTKITSVDFISNGKAVQITHFPAYEEDEKPENSVSIRRVNGRSIIDTYNGAWEAALYIAARIHQTSLAPIANKVELNSDLKQAARLFEFSEDLTPYLAENGQFIWNIDEFDKWLAQPKYRHAFAHMKAAMQEFKLDPTYEISDEFMSDWKNSFYVECLQNTFMGTSTPLFQKAKGISPKLDRIEQLIPLLGNRINELSTSDINNVHRTLHKAHERHPALREQVQKILSTIEIFDPFFKLMEPEFNSSNPLMNKPLIKDPEASAAIIKLKADDIQKVSWEQRFTVLTKLFNMATRNPETMPTSADIALKFEACAISFSDVENDENNKLQHLSDIIDNRQEFQTAKREWSSWTLDQKCAHLHSFTKLFARIFNCDPADQVTVYKEPTKILGKDSGKMKFITHGFATHEALKSKEYYEKNFPDLKLEANRLIAANVHQDSGILNDYETALAFICHEQAHLWQSDLEIALEKGNISPIHPYSRLVDMMKHDFSPWHNIDRNENPSLSFKFYRARTNERHAFALQERFYSIRTGQPLNTEADIFRDCSNQYSIM